MFVINDAGVFDVLNGMLKERQDEVYVSENFMATWIPRWNRSLVVVGDYRQHSQEDIERILVEHFEEVNRDIDSKGKA